MKSKMILVLVIAMIFSMLMVSCNTKEIEDSEGKVGTTELTTTSFNTDEEIDPFDFDVSQRDKIVDSYFDIFKATIDSENSSMVSPYSIIQAFAVCANGADDNTLAELEKVFNMPISDLNQWNRNFYSDMLKRDDTPLKSANSFWYNKNDSSFKVKSDFLDTIGEYYDAKAYEAPFNNETVKDINQWVSENTKERINKILDHLNDNYKTVIVNAVTFDGTWETPYEDSNVENGDFTKEDGSKEDVEFMYSSEDRYIKGKNYCGFIKPYNSMYSFVAILPEEGTPVKNIIDQLDGKEFINAINDASFGHVEAKLPKFEYSYQVENLISAMESLGVNDLFNSESCNLSKMYTSEIGENLFVSDAIHKTYIKVDEKGTEAAAVTGLMMKATGMPAESYVVNLDRPFVYAIVDSVTNVPLFIGTYMGM